MYKGPPAHQNGHARASITLMLARDQGSMTEIFVVAEDPTIVDGFIPLLNDAGFKTVLFPDLGSAARFTVEIRRPDMLLVDISSRREKPEHFCNVIECTGVLHEIPRVIVNEGKDPRQRYDCFMCGSAGYFIKPLVPGDLLARISHVVSRPAELWSSIREDILELGPIHLDCTSLKVTVAGRENSLSAAQVLILRHFMTHPGEVVSGETLLVEVLGYPPGPADDTDLIRLQIWNLRRRLEAEPANPSLLVTVQNEGYRLAVLPDTRFSRGDGLTNLPDRFTQ